MDQFVWDHFEHSMAAFAFLGRAADLASTRFVSPTLVLEANAIARRLGWPFAYATLATPLLAYLPDIGPPVAFVLGVVSLLAAASNLGGWTARALGEGEAQAHLLRAAARATAVDVYGAIWARAALTAIAGGALLFFYPEPDEWAWYFAIAMLVFAVALALHSTVAIRRLRLESQRAS